MLQEDLKLSDLAGAKPFYQDIHINIEPIMDKYPTAVHELDRVLFGQDRTHIDPLTQTMNGYYDINLLPYYKYRLETTPIFHTDDTISTFIGNLENYLTDVTDLVIERDLKAKTNNEILTQAQAVFPELKAQSKQAQQALKKMFATAPAPEPSHDAVSHPSYYELPSGTEAKDVIRMVLGDEGYEIWNQGTALKYLLRYPNKENPIMDLNKAKQYIDFILELRQEKD